MMSIHQILKNVKMKKMVINLDHEKRITLRIDADDFKKLKVKAVLKDLSVNEYINTLISNDIGNVDLSRLVDD